MRRTAILLATLLALAGCARTQRVADPTGPSGGVPFEVRAAHVVAQWQQLHLDRAWRTGLVPIGELTKLVGGDPGFTGDTKVAFTEGSFRLAGQLPTAVPAPAVITFPDGKPLTVPVVGAAQAYAELGGTGAKSNVPALTVTGATLGSVALLTSRGTVQAPAWIFTIPEIRIPVARVAVAPDAMTPLLVAQDRPDERVPGLSRPETVTPDGALDLTIGYTGGACDTSARGVVYETDGEVVLGVITTQEPGACTAIGIERTVRVTLTRPLDDRVLLDAELGGPIVPGAGRR
ncbi:MAG: hypothetical protein AUI14_18715 [Actinobacteria bacterium 13_2_20CM_2_71_6]|nr:MAG: hypothetical protein AUI14_18715 [Actinobacteria bacterium 13_2_20CM_2_71_6]